MTKRWSQPFLHKCNACWALELRAWGFLKLFEDLMERPCDSAAVKKVYETCQPASFLDPQKIHSLAVDKIAGLQIFTHAYIRLSLCFCVHISLLPAVYIISEPNVHPNCKLRSQFSPKGVARTNKAELSILFGRASLRASRSLFLGPEAVGILLRIMPMKIPVSKKLDFLLWSTISYVCMQFYKSMLLARCLCH